MFLIFSTGEGAVYCPGPDRGWGRCLASLHRTVPHNTNDLAPVANSAKAENLGSRLLVLESEMGLNHDSVLLLAR